MSIEGHRFYPGETATPAQLAQLAREYRQAADALLGNGRPRQPLSRAPYRLLAIHAVELYLSAVLLAARHPPADLRRMHHDLGARAGLAVAAGLTLRKRTLAHIEKLSATREYLATRYDPEQSGASELNRLAATLAEVGDKAASFLERTRAATAATTVRV